MTLAQLIAELRLWRVSYVAGAAGAVYCDAPLGVPRAVLDAIVVHHEALAESARQPVRNDPAPSRTGRREWLH